MAPLRAETAAISDADIADGSPKSQNRHRRLHRVARSRLSSNALIRVYIE